MRPPYKSPLPGRILERVEHRRASRLERPAHTLSRNMYPHRAGYIATHIPAFSRHLPQPDRTDPLAERFRAGRADIPSGYTDCWKKTALNKSKSRKSGSDRNSHRTTHTSGSSRNVLRNSPGADKFRLAAATYWAGRARSRRTGEWVGYLSNMSCGGTG